MNTLHLYSDLELISRLKQSDELAFREIFDRYSSLLVIYVYKKIKDKEESKDIVQDLFAQIWDNRENLGFRGPVSGYLYTAARNRALNIFRDRKIDDKYLLSLQHMLVPGNENADHIIREKDITALIDYEIQALPPKMREVFQLRRNRYLSNREIAIELNISEQTVATHIKRALRILRSKLGLVAYLICLMQIK